jgi:hypothetical protein
VRDLGIEFISVFGLPPVEFVYLAADLGCRHISTSLTGARLESLGYPTFSLRDDARLRQDLLTAIDDRGISISLGEGMVIAPDADVSGLAADLDIMAEIGAAQINTISFDRDRNRNRTFDQLAQLTELAAERGDHRGGACRRGDRSGGSDAESGRVRGGPDGASSSVRRGYP